MNIKKNHRSIIRKPLFWVITAICLILLLVIAEKTGLTNFISPYTPSGPTPEQQKQDAATAAAKKKALIEGDGSKAEPYNTSSPASSEKSIDMRARQEDDGTVTVFTKLYGYSDGSCSLTINANGNTVTQTAKVMYQPEYASCTGFSVPIDQAGKGNWIIKLAVNSANVMSDKSIVLEVK